jgi:hypothetical protein
VRKGKKGYNIRSSRLPSSYLVGLDGDLRGHVPDGPPDQAHHGVNGGAHQREVPPAPIGDDQTRGERDEIVEEVADLTMDRKGGRRGKEEKLWGGFRPVLHK